MSNFLNLILTCLFYSPLVPVAIPIAFIGAVLNYWVTKWMLVYVHKHPDELSDLLTTFFVNLLPFASVIWAGAYLFFIDKTRIDINNKNNERSIQYKNLTTGYGSFNETSQMYDFTNLFITTVVSTINNSPLNPTANGDMR